MLSPIFSKRRVFSSYASVASLHSDAQMAECSVAAFSAGRATTEEETPARTSPFGAYPSPSTRNSERQSAAGPFPGGSTALTTQKRVAVMALVVSVPVLSLQMTDVQPSVSTDGSERTTALRLAILRVPSAGTW